METFLFFHNFLSGTSIDSKYLTYKEWKRISQCKSKVRHSVTRKYLTYKEWKLVSFFFSIDLLNSSVSTLPIRNGNINDNKYMKNNFNRKYLTYKEWKRPLEINIP